MALNIKRARKTIPFYEDRAIGEQVIAAQAAVDEARNAVEEAKKAASEPGPDARLTSKAPTVPEKALVAAEKALAKAEAEAKATVLDVTLEALPRKRWAEAEESHPPREGKSQDQTFSVNVSSFFHEVLPLSVVEVKQRSTGELRTDITPEDWAAALDEIDDGQYSRLALAILGLNRQTANPF